MNIYLKEGLYEVQLKRSGEAGFHAEYRALSDLAHAKWGDTYVDPYIFDMWLKNDVVGYIRKIRHKSGVPKVQACCINCDYFTEGVTYMRIN
jgi:hypothetical protein